MTKDELVVAAYTAERRTVLGRLNRASPRPGYSRVDGEDGVGYILPNNFFTWQPSFDPHAPVTLTLIQVEGQPYALTQHVARMGSGFELAVSPVMQDVPRSRYASVWDRLNKSV